MIVEMKTPRIHASGREVLWICLGVLFDCHCKIVFILLSQLSFGLSQYETAVVSASEVEKKIEKREIDAELDNSEFNRKSNHKSVKM